MTYQTCCRKGPAEAAETVLRPVEVAETVLKTMILRLIINCNSSSSSSSSHRHRRRSSSSSNDDDDNSCRLYACRMICKLCRDCVLHSFAFAAFLRANFLRYSASHPKTSWRLCCASIWLAAVDKMLESHRKSTETRTCCRLSTARSAESF